MRKVYSKETVFTILETRLGLFQQQQRSEMSWRHDYLSAKMDKKNIHINTRVVLMLLFKISQPHQTNNQKQPVKPSLNV